MTNLDALRLERDRAMRAGEYALAEQLSEQLRAAEERVLEPELAEGCDCNTRDAGR